MRFLTRNLDACVTYKIIIPRCGDITFVKCENRFEKLGRISNFPILFPFFEKSILRIYTRSGCKQFFFALEKIRIIDGNLIRNDRNVVSLPTQNRIPIDLKFHRINSSVKLDRTTTLSANYELLWRKDVQSFTTRFRRNWFGLYVILIVNRDRENRVIRGKSCQFVRSTCGICFGVVCLAFVTLIGAFPRSIRTTRILPDIFRKYSFFFFF